MLVFARTENPSRQRKATGGCKISEATIAAASDRGEVKSAATSGASGTVAAGGVSRAAGRGEAGVRAGSRTVIGGGTGRAGGAGGVAGQSGALERRTCCVRRGPAIPRTNQLRSAAMRSSIG